MIRSLGVALLLLAIAAPLALGASVDPPTRVNSGGNFVYVYSNVHGRCATGFTITATRGKRTLGRASGRTQGCWGKSGSGIPRYSVAGARFYVVGWRAGYTRFCVRAAGRRACSTWMVS